MNEFRLDPDTMTFTIVTDAKEECKACVDNGEEIASIPFDRGFTKVYEIKRDVQPSKYELTGSLFKSSVAHGYEEIIIENKEHENRIRKYTNEEIEQLLSIVAERVAEIEKYGLGGNIVITRKTDGHGFFDVFILPIPKNERKSCMECEAIQNIGDREVCKTENFVVYTPFAPKYDFELVISPRTHRQFKDCDNTVFFDLAAVVKKTLESQKVDLTMAIIQGQDGHFKMSVVGGSRNAFELLGVSRVRINPSVLAKEFRDAKVYER